jgi:hypothetical protein
MKKDTKNKRINSKISKVRREIKKGSKKKRIVDKIIKEQTIEYKVQLNKVVD